MKTIGSQSIDQKLKTIFFRHWEKIVLGLSALGIFGFFWFGRVKPYDKISPVELRNSVEAARRYIDDPTSWSLIADFRKANDTAADVIGRELKVVHEPLPNFLGTKMATRGLRTDPAIKDILEPRAKVLVGSLLIDRPLDANGNYLSDYWTQLIVIRKAKTGGLDAARNDGGDEDAGLTTRGRAPLGGAQAVDDKKAEPLVYISETQNSEFKGIPPKKYGLTTEQQTTTVVTAVAVTGLFPHELQLGEYERFKEATKYNELRDQPYYVYLQIERRKRLDGKETDWEDITKLVTEDLPKKYAATAPEIVEESFVDPYLTGKIPPFVWLDFNPYCSTSQTPVIVEKEANEDEIATTKSTRRITLGNSEPTSEEEKPKEDETKLAVAKYKLIRFFDLSVIPNEIVQYRFRVWLADPNDAKRQVYNRLWDKDQLDAANASGLAGGDGEDASGVSGTTRGGARGSNRGQATNLANAGNPFEDLFKDLDPDVRKRLKERDALPELPQGLEFLKYSRPSNWSEPTEWISVPQTTGEIVAGRIDAGLEQNISGVTYFEDEPQVDILVKKWDPALQVELPVSRKVYRSDVMNFRSNAKVINPISQEIFDVKRELSEEGTEENGVKFDANSFVVDMIGGEKMPFSTAEKSYFEPSEILVMLPNGTMTVRNELADRTEYRHGVFAEDERLSDVQTQAKTEKKKDDSEGGIGRGRGGRGGRGR